MTKMLFAGVVLAGGLSSRMGQDKAELTLNNQTLLSRMEKLLLDAGAMEVLISRNKGEPGLNDLYSECGPLGGIYTILQSTQQDLLIVPVDMPLLDAKLLKALLIADVAASYFADFPLPLFLQNSKTVNSYLKDKLEDASSDRSLKRMLKHIGAVELHASEQHKLVNINTPKQYQQIKQQLSN